jgi:hypothetical protein
MIVLSFLQQETHYFAEHIPLLRIQGGQLMQLPRKSDHLKIKGVIAPKDRDKGGNVVQVLLETKNFERYTIADNKIGRELIDLLGKEVLIQGLLSGEDIDGSDILFVQRYDVL